MPQPLTQHTAAPAKGQATALRRLGSLKGRQRIADTGSFASCAAPRRLHSMKRHRLKTCLVAGLRVRPLPAVTCTRRTLTQHVCGKDTHARRGRRFDPTSGERNTRTSGLGCGGAGLGLWRSALGLGRLRRGSPFEERVLERVLRLDALVGVQCQHLLQQIRQGLHGNETKGSGCTREFKAADTCDASASRRLLSLSSPARRLLQQGHLRAYIADTRVE